MIIHQKKTKVWKNVKYERIKASEKNSNREYEREKGKKDRMDEKTR